MNPNGSGSSFKQAFETMVANIEQGKTVALVTFVKGHQGLSPGSRLVFDGGGQVLAGATGSPGLDDHLTQAVRAVITAGVPGVVTLPAEEEGTPGPEVFIEPFLSPWTLVILGAGHIGKALAELGRFLGFRLVVVDDRVDYANARRFPTADEIVVDDFIEAVNRLMVDERTCLVLVTRGHQHDKRVLGEIIGRPAGYLGMIGSRRRVRAVFDSLRKKGTPEELISRVRAPIGLDIGAETVEEIAISIMAEVILELKGGTGRPLSRPEGAPVSR